MGEYPPNWTPGTIAEAIEENLYQMYLRVGQAGQRPIYESEHYSWVNALPSCWPSTVFRVNLTGQAAKDALNQLAQQIRERKAPTSAVTVQGSGASEYLLKQGAVKLGEWAGMAAPLDAIPNELAPLPGLTIHSVSHERDIRDWMRVSSAALLGGGPLDETLIARLIELDDFQLYLGRYEGEPVATSMLFMHRNVAGVYVVSALEPHRNRGIGKRITLAALHDAKSRGCPIAILQATWLGERIYSKLDFTEFMRFDRWSLHGLRTLAE